MPHIMCHGPGNKSSRLVSVTIHAHLSLTAVPCASHIHQSVIIEPLPAFGAPPDRGFVASTESERAFMQRFKEILKENEFDV